MASIITMTNGLCGCARLWRVEVPTDLPGFITEESNDDPNTSGYQPFVAENSTEEDYLFFVPEDYNEMSTPIKKSELPLVTDLPEGTRFDIIIPTGDPEQPFENYGVEFDEMVGLIAPLFRRTVTVETAGNRVNIPNLPPIIGIGASPNYLGEDEFIQDADGFETIDGTSWDANKKLTLFF